MGDAVVFSDVAYAGYDFFFWAWMEAGILGTKGTCIGVVDNLGGTHAVYASTLADPHWYYHEYGPIAGCWDGHAEQLEIPPVTFTDADKVLRQRFTRDGTMDMVN